MTMAHDVRQRPRLAVSIGCPAGVGPEVAVRAASELTTTARTLLVGDEQVIRRAARLLGVSDKSLVPIDDARALDQLSASEVGIWRPSTPLDPLVTPGTPTRLAGEAQLSWIDEAVELVRQGGCDALVTGPVSKAVIAQSQRPDARRFVGHTEHLARKLGARDVVMAFFTEAFTTALVTTHLPLRDVPDRIVAERVAMVAVQLVSLLGRLGRDRPRVVVAGLNPHAGEAGLLGDEEQQHIFPGIQLARQQLSEMSERGREAQLTGPVGAETAFRKAAAGEYDGVVAMYHDQATIACKLLGFGEAVNVTLGLPIVRTSVDHGTAYDLAGSGRASCRGMHEALRLACELSRSNR
jgi:4-hydroxythreonine-4-phosphate dehydrogenase